MINLYFIIIIPNIINFCTHFNENNLYFLNSYFNFVQFIYLIKLWGFGVLQKLG